MPRKKEEPQKAAEIIEQPITETIIKNYMPYTMSVIVSRAIPAIDGFKPSHRKLLYTMYKMGLLHRERVKSATVVGETLRLNPHGNDAVYQTLVRLTRAHEALLHPFVDSKGSFGKHYSSDMDCAAMRYTEVKLDKICEEIFRGIEKNAVDFVENYDNTTVEPTLLPTAFPNVLVSPNIGVAVGMASSICSFNLAEVCDGAIALLKNPNLTAEDMLDIIKAPDFSTGAFLIYDREKLLQIYRTGQGSVRLRSRWVYDKKNNCIEIVQIPYSTTIELILKRIAALVKDGKLKEISDFRDEIDINGFRLTIDLRRDTDPEKLMAKLFKHTPLEDSFDCNFNILVDGVPRQMGIVEILHEWIRFRMGCLRRELEFELDELRKKLHLLLGLSKILLDIDLAIRIIRDTKTEAEVVPNLMEGFGIDKEQAEFVAEIRLRNLNREYILNRTREIESLRNEISELESILASEEKIKKIIISQLLEIKKKFGQPRKTQLLLPEDIKEFDEEEYIEDYGVRVVLTREGYFKKVTFASLRGNDEHKLKEGDEIIAELDTTNTAELIFFSDKAQAYKAKASEFEPTKASALGDFLPAKLGLDDGERIIAMQAYQKDSPLDKNFVIIFENGKGVRVPASAYETKSNRRKLTGAYSDASPVVAIYYEDEPFDLLLISSQKKGILINTELIPQKSTRTSVGVQLFTLRSGHKLIAAVRDLSSYPSAEKCRKRKIPAAGVAIDELDAEKQQIKLN
ncbi:MAG TPA: DNA topoisomerase (ATP-hydrolyzing) subunit A [Bacillota bacterium]|nr:DNA topoisomerase (ATP-hydrolyzing) subunit A [Bacillota bacterium]